MVRGLFTLIIFLIIQTSIFAENTCTQVYNVTQNDETCTSVSLSQMVRTQRLIQLNSEINCDKYLPVGQVLCLNNGIKRCISFRNVKNTTCDQIVAELGMNPSTFMNINPQLNCSSNIENSFICTNAVNPDCLMTHNVTENDTIDSILEQYELNINELNKANPYMQEDGLVPEGVICIKMKPESSRIDYFIDVFGKLGELDPNLKTNLFEYINNPNKTNEISLQEQFMKSLNNYGLRHELLIAEKTNPVLMNYMNEQNLTRIYNCENFKNLTSTYPNASVCFCNASEPITYCLKLLKDEMVVILNNTDAQRAIKNLAQYMAKTPAERFYRHRNKRQTCSLSGLIESFSGGYISYGCCYSIFCGSIGGSFPRIYPPYFEYGLRYISVFGTFQICIPYVNSVLKFLNLLNIWDGCIATYKLSYYVFRKNIENSISASVALISVTSSFTWQITNPSSYIDCNSYDKCSKIECYLPAGSVLWNGVTVDVSLIFFHFSVYSYKDTQPYCSPPTRKTSTSYYKTTANYRYQKPSSSDQITSYLPVITTGVCFNIFLQHDLFYNYFTY